VFIRADGRQKTWKSRGVLKSLSSNLNKSDLAPFSTYRVKQYATISAPELQVNNENESAILRSCLLSILRVIKITLEYLILPHLPLLRGVYSNLIPEAAQVVELY